MSISQTNALPLRLCTSIQSNRGTAESNWGDRRTFGGCRCHRMIGRRDNAWVNERIGLTIVIAVLTVQIGLTLFHH